MFLIYLTDVRTNEAAENKAGSASPAVVPFFGKAQLANEDLDWPRMTRKPNALLGSRSNPRARG